MYRYSMTQWITGKESIECCANRLKRCGYDGIELTANPYTDVEKTVRVLENLQLPCTSLCGIYPPERNLSSEDKKIRMNAVQYVKDSIDMAVEVKCKIVIVVPSAVGVTVPTCSCAWEYSKESLMEVAEYAESKKIHLALEAVNRFETYLINTLEMARKMVTEVGSPNLKLMADLFHMNIEERDIQKALTEAASHLIHVHVADNTREPAGKGHTDFGECFRILKAIDYQGCITMEFLPRVSNPYSAQEETEHGKLMDQYAQDALNYCKSMEVQVEQKLVEVV